MSTLAPEAPPAEAPAEKPKAEIPPGLQLELFEGRKVTGIEIQVAGKVVLNLENPDHLRLWQSLRLGKEVDLTVHGMVRHKNNRAVADKDGYHSDTVGKAVVAIDNVFAV